MFSDTYRHGQRCIEIITRIGRKQVVPKERYKPKTIYVLIRERTFLAQETQEGFIKETVEPAGP